MLKLKCLGKKTPATSWWTVKEYIFFGGGGRSFGGLKAQVKSDFKFWHNPLLLHEGKRKSGNFAWAGHGDSLGSAAPFSMHLGLICYDKEAPRTASVWNLSETESQRCMLPSAGIHIKADAHITLRISHRSISSDQLPLRLHPPFLSLRSSVRRLYLFDLAAWAARLLCTARLRAVKYSLFLCVMTFTHPGSRGENKGNATMSRRKRRRFHDKCGL